MKRFYENYIKTDMSKFKDFSKNRVQKTDTTKTLFFKKDVFNCNGTSVIA